MAFGHNRCGQLGLGYGGVEAVTLPRSVPSLHGREVVQMSLGRHHSVVRTALGGVLTCGWDQVRVRAAQNPLHHAACAAGTRCCSSALLCPKPPVGHASGSVLVTR